MLVGKTEVTWNDCKDCIYSRKNKRKKYRCVKLDKQNDINIGSIKCPLNAIPLRKKV